MNIIARSIRPKLTRTSSRQDLKTKKNGQYKVISFYAKKARGLMVNYAAKNQITDVEKLKDFDADGYYFVDELSDDTQWLFRRDEQV